MDGKIVATQKMEKTMPFSLPLDETFDVGSKTGTPVDDCDYQTPFTFTGTLKHLTISVEEPKLTPEDIERLKKAGAKASDTE